MPELPEVETTIRGLRPVLEGQVLTAVDVRRPDLRRPVPVDLRQRLTGARVTALGRRAKYGLIDTDRGDRLIFHLGMSGRWRIEPDAIGTHDHLVLTTDANVSVALNDPRRFGSLDLVAIGDDGLFAGIGPEPLGDLLTPEHLQSAFAGRRTPVKALLLDQRVVAGLGNIYVCEALHMAHIAPTRLGSTVSATEAAALVAAIRAVLLAAIDAGGSTLRDYARPDGELGYFAKEFLVYGREGAPCRCGGTVTRLVQSGRSTFWCPNCQR